MFLPLRGRVIRGDGMKNAITDAAIRAQFAGAGDFNARRIRAGGQWLTVYAVDGLTSGGEIAHDVLRPLMASEPQGMEALYDRALYSGVYSAVAAACTDAADCGDKLLNGFCVVLFPGVGAVVFEAKTSEKRTPAPPEVENTVKGPKDAFTETLRTNTSLLRRHLRTGDLCLRESTVGSRSGTRVAVASLRGVTDPALVERVCARLDSINADGLLSPAGVEEYLTGSRPTAFPLAQYTERADKLAQGLLEGRVGVLVDGLPLGYLLPVCVADFMQTPEDRSTDYLSASFLRLMRYAALLVSLFLPALFIAMTGFDPEMIPLPLLEAIIESKQSVPFPTVFEVLGLLLAFEVVQEAGLSLPRSVGQTLSIIGGLVVGTAAVEARLISPSALIVVAAAGVCGYTLPGREFSDALRLWRLILAVSASLSGLFGLSAAFLLLLIRLAGLESFGRSYLAPFAYVRGADKLVRPRLKDLQEER